MGAQEELDAYLARRGGSTAKKKPDAPRKSAAEELDDYLAKRGGGEGSTEPKVGGGGKDNKASLLGQLKNQIAGAVTGLPDVAGAVGSELRNIVFDPDDPGMLSTLLIGQEDAQARRDRAAVKRGPDAPDAFGRFKQRLADSAPFSASIVESNQRTLGDILHPSRIKKASDEGRLVERLTEDFGNAAIIAGPAVKGVTGSSKITAAAEKGGVVGNTAKAFEFAADSLQRPILKPASAVGRATLRLDDGNLAGVAGSRIAKSAAGEGPMSSLSQIVEQAVESRPAVMETARTLGLEGTKAREEVLRPLAKALKATKDAVEEQATLLIHKGDAEALLRPMVRKLEAGEMTEAQFRQAIASTDNPNTPAKHLKNPEAVKMAVAYLDDALDPKVAARLDKATTHMGEAQKVINERYRTGKGTTDEQPGDPAQFGNEAIPSVIAEKVAPQLKKVEANRTRLAEAQAVADAKAARRAEIEGMQAVRLQAEAGGLRRLSEQLRAEQTIKAGDSAATMRARADAEVGFPARTPFLQGKAAQRAGDLGRQAATVVAKAPDSRRISQLDLKASLKEKRAERILTSKAKIVADDGATSVARFEETQAKASVKAAAAKLERSLAKTEKVKEKARLSVDAAPARMRPILMAAKRAAKELSEEADRLDARKPGAGQPLRAMLDELPTDIDKLNALGVGDRINHIMTTLGNLEDDGVRKISPKGAAPKIKSLASENRRRGDISPLTLQGVAKLYDQQTRRAIGNITAKQMAKDYGKTADDMGLGHLKGEKLVAAMKELRLEPYEIVGSGPGSFINARAGSSTLFLPQSLAKEFKGWSSHRSPIDEFLSATYDRGISAFKIGVLPLSPRWHIGNVVGNMLLSTVSAGMSPSELAKYGREAKALFVKGEKFGEGEWGGRAAGPEFDAVRGGGLANDTADVLNPVRREKRKGKVRTAGSAVVASSFAMNRMVDDFSRTAVMLRNVDKMGDIEKAMVETLKTMGDFGKMSVTERAVIRRVLPFWAWQREITKISTRLPVHHPYRVAWFLHLGGNLGGGAQEQNALPDWAKGSIPIGNDKMLRLAFLNPFGDVSEPIWSWKGFAKSTSPLIKLPVETGMNRSLEKARELTAPAGTDKGVHPIGLIPALSKVLGTMPQTRALRDLPGEKVVRYGTTDPVLRNGRTISAEAPGGKLANLAAAAGVPWPTYSQTEADKKRAAAYDKRDRKSRATYDKKRRAAADREPAKR